MNITPDNWIALLPILITSATVVVVMLSIAVRRSHNFNATLCVIGLNFALLSCIAIAAAGLGTQHITSLLVVDNFSLLYMGMILGAALATATLSHTYMAGYAGAKEELYLLLALSALGGLVLVCATDFTTFFIGITLMSVPMYGLIAYPHKDRRALEAGIKYLVLSAIASAFILFGMALIYAHTGTLSFELLTNAIKTGSFAGDGLLATGGALILVGIAFEIGLVPCHLWAPDVYEGAPAPIAGYLSTATKAAVFAVLLRYFVEARVYDSPTLMDVLGVVAFLSIVIGNVLALFQENIKRMLAYSAIAHFGYTLVAFVAAGPFAVEAATFYLLTYVVTELAAFGVISLMSSPIKASDADKLYDYRGLFWRRPYLASILTGMLLSLAGIPMTACFIGKLYIFAASVDAHMWILTLTVVFGSSVGLFYYLRAAIGLFQRQRWVQPFEASSDWSLRAGGVMLLGLSALMFLLGFYPTPFVDLVKQSGLRPTTAMGIRTTTSREPPANFAASAVVPNTLALIAHPR